MKPRPCYRTSNRALATLRPRTARYNHAIVIVGSSAVAAWIAELAFWGILGLGVVFGEVSRRAAAIFVALWAIGFFGLRGSWGPFVTPYVAVLDIVLAFVVFKGDVRLT